MIIENEQLLFTTIIENEALADFNFLLTSTQTCKNALFLQIQGPFYSQGTRKLYKWPHFFIYFFELYLFVAWSYIWKYWKLISVCFILICKSLNFVKKLMIHWTHCTFLKSRHLRDTKNSYQVLPKNMAKNYNSV